KQEQLLQQFRSCQAIIQRMVQDQQPPRRESIHTEIEKDAIYDEMVTDIVRSYSDSFDDITGHISGPNNT
ncbi:MAG: hypothetical protein CMJ19_22020, partial [Phycisphaeraceae bacterium]|nr:hypothetical protein [Phycisphaeraceae bacterium]